MKIAVAVILCCLIALQVDARPRSSVDMRYRRGDVGSGMPYPDSFVVSNSGTCDGFCGGMADGGCYCDNACHSLGDCCNDKVELCGDESASGSGWLSRK